MLNIIRIIFSCALLAMLVFGATAPAVAGQGNVYTLAVIPSAPPVQERTMELEEKNAELYKMNRLFVGRELRMVELKERIKVLEEKAT